MVDRLSATFEIRVDDLRGPQIAALLQEHLDNMVLHSPPQSVHALDLQALRAPSVTFWSAWAGGELLGCAALKQLRADHGEIKSMRSASRHLRKGVAADLLTHLIDVAQQRDYARLSLETGSAAAFAPAHALYTRFGFAPCAPFADYIDDPYSVFMTRTL
ncbi:MAG: putative acetyltransferase [Gammaproteobacteria bacterium]|jgi:putative acetyltransferase